MQDDYIKELIACLEETQVSIREGQKALGLQEGISVLLERFTDHKRRGSQCFFVGNGGSAAIASHMTADYMKNGGMNTYSWYDRAVTTCMGTDYGYEAVFCRPLEFLGREGDLLVAVSSSGSSQNILNAIYVAQGKKMEIVTFTGFDPQNGARRSGDVNVYVPSRKYGMVESIHNLILQEVVDLIMERDGVSL